MKTKGTKTIYPGVYRIDSKTYRITAKFRDPRTGKDRWIQRLLEGVTAHEAVIARGQLLEQVKLGPTGNGSKTRIGEFAKSWLESKALHVSVATVERYGYALQHALGHFGNVYAHEIRSTDVQGWIDSEIRAGHAPDTIRAWFSAVRTMLRDAVEALELPRDPTRRIRLPERREKAEPNAFTPEELGKFLTAMLQHRPQHYALTATLAFTGMRFCHVSPLKWRDVDLDAGTLTIRRKQVRGVIGPVSRKKRAPLVYPIGVEMVSILRWHRERCPGQANGWVFPTRDGTLRKAPSSLTKAWRHCLRRAGVDRRVTVHGMRYTFTDLARRAGVDSVVSRSLVGHVTERMREHYSTVNTDEQRDAQRSIQELVTTQIERVGPKVGPDDEGGSGQT